MLAFRITFSRYSDLHDAAMQMMNGGILVRVADVSGIDVDAPASLELVLPDGSTMTSNGKVLQVLSGMGVALTVAPELVGKLHGRVGKDSGSSPAKHERLAPAEPAESPRVARSATATAVPSVESMSTPEKIQAALHGNRDQRAAILRDHNRSLHPYVLKNPQLSAEEVIAIAKNATLASDLLKQLGERKEWLQKPQVAVALARNPKTPGELAIRALDYVPADALRQMAKGTGVLPHVAQAARKKVIK